VSTPPVDCGVERRRCVDLTRQIRDGDVQAGDALVRQFGRAIGAALLRYTRGDSLAQDLYQETFRLGIEKLRKGELRDPERLPGFLASIARNLAREHFRSAARRRPEPLDDVQSRDPDPFERLLALERAELVREVISDLDCRRDRELLRRFYIDDEDKERLCEELHLSSSHFNRVLFRARQRCRELFEERAPATKSHRG
jgi:RNA polymerase sigma-70 factor, ECF subfamily